MGLTENMRLFWTDPFDPFLRLEAQPNRAKVMERTDAYCAIAYWYLERPVNGLPAIAPASERMKDLP